jgi:hypothetical protein
MQAACRLIATWRMPTSQWSADHCLRRNSNGGVATHCHPFCAASRCVTCIWCITVGTVFLLHGTGPQLKCLTGASAREAVPGCNEQVARVLNLDHELSLALSNTWLRRARIKLPPVAIAIDDALLRFGDTLQRTLQPANGVADIR